MASLVQQRCFNHSEREAVARCSTCRKFFCRECATEYDDRIICAGCLSHLAKTPLRERRGFVGVVRFFQFAAGMLALWLFFFFLGERLLSTPTQFHENTLWKANWLDEE